VVVVVVTMIVGCWVLVVTHGEDEGGRVERSFVP
jgi:hypothetical protein